jgi:lipopolysaccharide/colanic/teichoic acid biosynthesis glycosyltransferase/RimJ/RimL family protein N-acetyltransferase
MTTSFYVLRPDTHRTAPDALGADYTCVLWRPAPWRLVPRGVPLIPFVVWWLMHYARGFRNRGYGLCLIYGRGELVHRSGVFPGYLRFPFMGAADLQIGDTWTHADHRNQGLATYAVRTITSAWSQPDRTFWYLVDTANPASARVVEKLGFERVGFGTKHPRFGMGVLGAYEIDSTGEHTSASSPTEQHKEVAVYPSVKRAIDVVLSLVGLIILSPLLIYLAIRIKRDSPGPVFYQGTRVGLNGVPFKMLKFRTMVINADKIGGSSTPDDDPRITRTGKMLRRYKLDELPQLINVLRGDMSFVGPRPQVQWAVDLYTPEERQVLTVRPGITDYASLQFSNEGEILKGSTDPDKDYMEKIHPHKMRLSLQYVRTMSLGVDLAIIARTILAIIKR